jgi:hypothetical protein
MKKETYERALELSDSAVILTQKLEEINKTINSNPSNVSFNLRDRYTISFITPPSATNEILRISKECIEKEIKTLRNEFLKL